MLILITGGSRSGKSRLAQELAAKRAGPHAFVATAVALDAEMQERIRAHQRSRPAGWALVEEPRRVPEAVAGALAAARTVVLDCVTLWMSNLLLADEGFDERGAEAAAAELVTAAGAAPSADLIVVTNEVGSGVVPDNALARRFRDCAGRANEVLARGAGEVYLCVSGIPLRIKPAGAAPLAAERNENHG
ncbi:MAG TPA: bifunctional adenosylcobinamide kinase/adenosylcobinamide-phosphate guanylyltransferase [Spirochaetia bacterium]|nr:bifunctional adenosylcobinamide kinase/adenosylcobinamide-phosphate guanylyltransferase [Spirochaetia bacterium]